MDYSSPGIVVPGILQARIPEWVAISYARGSSQPRNRTLFSCIAGRLFTSYKGRPLQSTEQHFQLLPLDVSRSPIPCPPPPVRRRKCLQTLLKVLWDNIPRVQNHCSRAFLIQRTHKPHWKYHFHPLLHCSVLPNKSVLFLNIRSYLATQCWPHYHIETPDFFFFNVSLHKRTVDAKWRERVWSSLCCPGSKL